VEQSHLLYIRHNQGTLCAELYNQLIDAFTRLDTTIDPSQVGNRIILLASFTGSSRDMMQSLQNSFSIARKYGNASCFLTMTANPKWQEIQDALLPGQTAFDHSNLVSHAFALKKAHLLKSLTKNHIMGKVVAHVYTIEFQKRGLPHMHLLLWFDEEDKLRTPEHVDSFISASFPDPETHSRLHKLVLELMTHGPYGPDYPNAACMVNGQCGKHFPKPLCEITTVNDDSYPKPKHPNDGRQYEGRHNFKFDNNHVVSYSPILPLCYECHLNIELTFNIKSIKYIHKYVYKGHDCTTMEFGNAEDEIKQYKDAHYISAHEAFWRIMRNELHAQVPAVMALTVHLPNEQPVVFDSMQGEAQALLRAEHSKTALMAYFEANANDLISLNGTPACNILYVELPQLFTYNEESRLWKMWKKGFSIGCLHFANSACGERFYLRTLLTVVKGAKSFENLRTFEGVIYPTFKEACFAHGLLQDNGE
jgi:hypothetical protein